MPRAVDSSHIAPPRNDAPAISTRAQASRRSCHLVAARASAVAIAVERCDVFASFASRAVIFCVGPFGAFFVLYRRNQWGGGGRLDALRTQRYCERVDHRGGALRCSDSRAAAELLFAAKTGSPEMKRPVGMSPLMPRRPSSDGF